MVYNLSINLLLLFFRMFFFFGERNTELEYSVQISLKRLWPLYFSPVKDRFLYYVVILTFETKNRASWKTDSKLVNQRTKLRVNLDEFNSYLWTIGKNKLNESVFGFEELERERLWTEFRLEHIIHSLLKTFECTEKITEEMKDWVGLDEEKTHNELFALVVSE